MTTFKEQRKSLVRNSVAWFCMLMLLSVTSVYAQEKSISGTVKDENGEAIIGANVKLTEGSTGTITDHKGT